MYEEKSGGEKERKKGREAGEKKTEKRGKVKRKGKTTTTTTTTTTSSNSGWKGQNKNNTPKKNSTTVSPQKSNTTNQNMTALSANCHVSLSPQHIGPNDESKTKEKIKEENGHVTITCFTGEKKKRGNSERGEGTVVISFRLGVTDCLDDWGEGKEGGTKTSVAGSLSFLLGRCPLGRSAINCCRCPTPL